ncbi:MAG: T9SS type A sorting domain-containing protein [Chitinophagaceae bacterium]
MKRITRYNSLLVLFICTALCSVAQTGIPTPAVWFSLPTSDNWNKSVYGNARVMGYNGGGAYMNINDGAVNFGSASNPRMGSLVIVDTNNIKENVKLFGYGDASTAFPDNFTIACWIYAYPAENPAYARKIFYTDFGDSRFALIHKGADIYLRRTAPNEQALSDRHFDYLFGAPASLDAGEGWYYLTLVMGKRSDNSRYTKLYVGKPAKVKYDATGPRIVATTSDVLATNFGGAYAFTGVQSFMKTSVTEWGLGNVDDSDPVHGQLIAPVAKLADFTVWGTALTDSLARVLFNCMDTRSQNLCWAAPANQLKIIQKQTTATDSSAEKAIKTISVYPNPGSGELWVQLPAADNGSTASLLLTDLNGKVLYTRTVATGKTGQSVHLDVRSATKTKGIYMLQVAMAGKAQTFKIIIQ